MPGKVPILDDPRSIWQPRWRGRPRPPPSSPPSGSRSRSRRLRSPSRPSPPPGCRIYVADGDDIPTGHDLNDDRRPLPGEAARGTTSCRPGWCLLQPGKNGQTSSAYISRAAGPEHLQPAARTSSRSSSASRTRRGRWTSSTRCFDKIKDHDFNRRERVRGTDPRQPPSLWTSMTNNYTTILQPTRIMQASAADSS